MPRIPGKLLIDNDIQALRQAMAMTQEELADAIHVTRATIIAIEKGSYNPSLELAFRFAKFFDKSIDDIFYERGSCSE